MSNLIQQWRDKGALHAAAMLTPLFILLFLCIVLPMSMMFIYSFWKSEQFSLIQEFSTGNYQYILSSDVYLVLTGRAMLYGAAVTLVTVLLGYPLAYFLARHVTSNKVIWIHIVIIPLFTSVIIRYFAWRRILGSEGILNDVLQEIGLVDAPLEVLSFGPVASIIALTHIFLPFMVLAVWASLEAIPAELIQAAEDLGASRIRMFRTIVLPLSTPGLVAGMLFVFVPVTGEYFGVNMMGGTSGITITNIINDEFTSTLDWPMGSAMSFVLLLLTGLILTAFLVCIYRLSFVRNYMGTGT